MIVLCTLMMAAIAGYLLYRRQAVPAALVIAVPVASLLIFWVIVGQPLGGLADYAGSSTQIMSGYTEAMGSQRQFPGVMGYLPDVEILSYLAGACAVLWCLLRVRSISGLTKLFLGVCFALYLFVGFKSGFVRHDGHAVIAANCLIFAILLIGTMRWDRGIQPAGVGSGEGKDPGLQG